MTDDHADMQVELTNARLAVNDWHACATQDELHRWRQAQLRLIDAAKAVGRAEAAAPVPCAASPADEARLEFIRGVIEDTLADGPRPATKHQLERALRAIRIELTKARATREEPK